MNFYLTSFIILRPKVLPWQPSCNRLDKILKPDEKREGRESVSWQHLLQRRQLTMRSCHGVWPSKRGTFLPNRASSCVSWTQNSVVGVWELWLLKGVLEKSARFLCGDCPRDPRSLKKTNQTKTQPEDQNNSKILQPWNLNSLVSWTTEI